MSPLHYSSLVSCKQTTSHTLHPSQSSLHPSHHPSLHPPQHPSLPLLPFTVPHDPTLRPSTHSSHRYCHHPSPHPHYPSPLLTTPLTPPLQYLHSYKQLMSSEVDTANEGQHSTRLAEVEMSLEALSNVIHNNNGELQMECTVATTAVTLPHPPTPPPWSGCELCCNTNFNLLFSLLVIDGAPKVQMLALKVPSHPPHPPPTAPSPHCTLSPTAPSLPLHPPFHCTLPPPYPPAHHQVISCVTGNQKCVVSIASAGVLQFLLLAAHSLPQSEQTHLTLHLTPPHPSTPHPSSSPLLTLPHLTPSSPHPLLTPPHLTPPAAGRELVLEVMQALTSNTQIVKESIQKGIPPHLE